MRLWPGTSKDVEKTRCDTCSVRDAVMEETRDGQGNLPSRLVKVVAKEVWNRIAPRECKFLTVMFWRLVCVHHTGSQARNISGHRLAIMALQVRPDPQNLKEFCRSRCSLFLVLQLNAVFFFFVSHEKLATFPPPPRTYTTVRI